MLKNLIIGALATIIYHSHIVDATPIGKRIFAVICAFICVFEMMELLDDEIKERKNGRVHMVSQKSFARYKEWMKVEVKRKAAGQSEDNKKKLIIYSITHQNRYAFSGNQLQELLNLAKESEERSA